MSLLEKYQRIRNTFSYSIQSSAGVDRNDGSGDELGSFQIRIPNVPFPENQASQLGIFTLESFYFTSQTTGIYVSAGANGLPANSDYDISGFYVEINGLGLRPQFYTTAVEAELRSNKMFPIINQYGTERKASTSERVVAGGVSNAEVICSNPCGSVLQVKVYSMSDGELIGEQALDCVINFKIELLPNDFQEREMS
tara:strand:+ start:8550 stop:9140 length:591 start_codon:yes stop_codon:yes gene_type:complete